MRFCSSVTAGIGVPLRRERGRLHVEWVGGRSVWEATSEVCWDFNGIDYGNGSGDNRGERAERQQPFGR